MSKSYMPQNLEKIIIKFLHSPEGIKSFNGCSANFLLTRSIDRERYTQFDATVFSELQKFISDYAGCVIFGEGRDTVERYYLVKVDDLKDVLLEVASFDGVCSIPMNEGKLELGLGNGEFLEDLEREIIMDCSGIFVKFGDMLVSKYGAKKYNIRT